jgi:PHD/YefM family antitoxin component YafN of YafNO toxin-antitoxin module
MSRSCLLKRCFALQLNRTLRCKGALPSLPALVPQPLGNRSWQLASTVLLLLLLNASPLLAVVNLDLLEQAVVAGNELLAILRQRYPAGAIAAADRFELALREMALKGLDLPPDQCNAAAAYLLADGLILTTAVREGQRITTQAQQEVVRRIAQVGQICGVP